MTKTAQQIVETISLPPLAKMSLKSAYHMTQVLAFHDLYGQPRPALGSIDEHFNHMDNARVALRLGLIAEEFKELIRDGFGIEAKIVYVAPDPRDPEGEALVFDDLESAFKHPYVYRNGEQVADALGDLIYVIYGMALEMGYDLRDVVAEIHASNLTKLGEDGQPIKREDGKVLKGPNYVPPNIRAVLGFDD